MWNGAHLASTTPISLAIMKPSPSKFLFLLCKGLQRTKTTDNRQGGGGEQPDGWRHKRMRVICSTVNDASENALQMTVPDASLLPFFSLCLALSKPENFQSLFLLACLLACMADDPNSPSFLLSCLLKNARTAEQLASNSRDQE